MIHPGPFPRVSPPSVSTYTANLIHAAGREIRTAITAGAAELSAAARRGFLADPDRPKPSPQSLGSRVIGWIRASGGMHGNARHLFFANEFQGSVACKALERSLENLPRRRLDEIQERSQHFASASRNARTGGYTPDTKVQAIQFVEDELLSMLESADTSTRAKLLELRDTVAHAHPQLKGIILPKALIYSCDLGRKMNCLPDILCRAVLQVWKTPSEGLQRRIDDILSTPSAADFVTDTKHVPAT